jgi:hypothetical protein
MMFVNHVNKFLINIQIALIKFVVMVKYIQGVNINVMMEILMMEMDVQVNVKLKKIMFAKKKSQINLIIVFLLNQ